MGITLFQAPLTPCKNRTQQPEESNICVSIHLPPDSIHELSLTLTPRCLRQASPEDETSRRPNQGRPTTPSPSPSRIPSHRGQVPTPISTHLSGRAQKNQCASMASDTVEPPVVNNILTDIGGPDPVYPHQAGVTHPEDPLPMMLRAPKKYYNIYRGLKIGVFYDTWCVSKFYPLQYSDFPPGTT
jgi:hypothetical protein